MGAWGPGVFDNDVAEDWMSELESDGAAAIARALNEVVFQDADDCCMALAAAEVIAAAGGRKPRGCSEELTEWLSDSDFQPTASQREAAIQAATSIKAESELLDLWEGDAAWRKRIDGLLERLNNPKPARPKKPRRAAKIWHPESGKVPSPTQLKRYLEKELGGGISMYERKAWSALLFGEKFTDETLQYLSVFPELTSVDLDEASVTDEGLKHLADVKKLSHLNLTGTRVTGEGLGYLTSLPIRDLTMLETNLTDAALRHVGAMTEMVWLAIQYTDISDEGISHLTKLTKLEHLDIRRTNVTLASREILVQLKSQGCDVISDLKL